jgi:hypothetical protein
MKHPSCDLQGYDMYSDVADTNFWRTKGPQYESSPWKSQSFAWDDLITLSEAGQKNKNMWEIVSYVWSRTIQNMVGTVIYLCRYGPCEGPVPNSRVQMSDS